MAKATIASSLIGGIAGAKSGSLTSTLANSFLGNLSYPKYPNASLSLNGDEIANTKVTKKKISTNYNLTEDEKNLLDYTNKNLLSGLKNINVFSDEQRKGIQEQVDAYKKQGLTTLNETYTPMFRELKADIASRFGNLDNSIFMDNLNEIEKNRAKALETLTENILAKQSELYETELNNRYNYLNQLASVNQNLYSNIINFLQLAGTNAGA